MTEDLDFPQKIDREAAGDPLHFELYVDDDRYSVPTLYLIAAADETGALGVAEARLAESDHHCGVELWRDGQRLAALGAPRRLAGT